MSQSSIAELRGENLKRVKRHGTLQTGQRKIEQSAAPDKRPKPARENKESISIDPAHRTPLAPCHHSISKHFRQRMTRPIRFLSAEAQRGEARQGHILRVENSVFRGCAGASRANKFGSVQRPLTTK
jgi:hypothetical protein